MIPKEIKVTWTMMMYGETFYGRHKSQHQLQSKLSLGYSIATLSGKSRQLCLASVDFAAA